MIATPSPDQQDRSAESADDPHRSDPSGEDLGAGPLLEELEQLRQEFQNIGAGLGDLAVIKLTRLHLALRRGIRGAAVGIAILLVVSGLLLVSSVLLILGFAGAISAIFDWPRWAGQLLASGVAIPLVFGAVFWHFRSRDRALAERTARAMRSRDGEEEGESP